MLAEGSLLAGIFGNAQLAAHGDPPTPPPRRPAVALRPNLLGSRNSAAHRRRSVAAEQPVLEALGRQSHRCLMPPQTQASRGREGELG